MKIQITQVNLNRALNILSRVASSRTPLPILSNILLKASSNSLELAATNLEVAITHSAKGKIFDEQGIDKSEFLKNFSVYFKNYYINYPGNCWQLKNKVGGRRKYMQPPLTLRQAYLCRKNYWRIT